MNWFNVLKNAGLAQSQRQGFRLDDKDEDYVLEDDDDCFEKLMTYLKNAFNKFKPELEVVEERNSYDLYIIDAFKPNKKYSKRSSKTLSKNYRTLSMWNNLPDEKYCDLLDALKKINFENFIHSIQDINTIDSGLNENKVVGNIGINISGKRVNLNDAIPKAELAITFYENPGPNERDIAGYIDRREV
jgi:hypothetical protein|tara:strand:- start:62 stop:625 length:564 start_codon:yes stop_codon:yes gene_type:complete